MFDFAWVDDFAAARNEALAQATGDYVFWLDADDVVEPRGTRPSCRRLFDRLRCQQPTEMACLSVVRFRYVSLQCDPARWRPAARRSSTISGSSRVAKDVRWTYRVHEQILPALRRAKVPVQWTDITVRHTGYVDRALRTRKLERDTKILSSELEDRPNDPFILFNLGSIAIERQEWQRSTRFPEAEPGGSAPTDSITRKLFALIARVHQMLGDSTKAASDLRRRIEHRPRRRRALVPQGRRPPASAASRPRPRVAGGGSSDLLICDQSSLRGVRRYPLAGMRFGRSSSERTRVRGGKWKWYLP